MNCKNCKKQGCSLAGKDHEMSFECKAYIGITNYDRLRAMSVEEMAETFANQCLGRVCHHGDSCKDCWLDWLREEASE